MPTTPRPGDGRPDIEAELADDHQRRDRHDERLEDVRAEVVERVHPLLELDRGELLGRALGRLAVEQRLDDAVDEERASQQPRARR